MKTQLLGKSMPVSTAAPPMSILSRWASLTMTQGNPGLLSSAWKWIRERQVARSSPRRLQLGETISLGEKRFIAVVKIDGLQFLVGGGATNVALLTQLGPRESFGELLKESITVPKKQPVKRARRRIVKPTIELTKEQA